MGMLWSATCRVPADLDAVTSRNAIAETDPRELGVDPAKIEGIWKTVRRLYRTGIHPAIALCLRCRGRVLVDRAIGHARGNGPDDSPEASKELATPATPFNLFSASKAVTAMVVHLLDQQGVLHLDDTVASHVPEYGTLGKQSITIRHVLTHRSGVPFLPPEGFDLEHLHDSEWMLRVLCAQAPAWRPGTRLAYHAISGGFILGEVVRRVTGADIREVLAREILRPLGFRWGNYGVAAEDTGRVAFSYVTGPPALPPLSTLIERALTRPLVEVVAMSNDARFMTAIVPAGNVITTANELSRFYQLLLDGGTLDGQRIFDERTIRRATAEQSYLELDLTLGAPIRYGMGFMLGADWLSPYGLHTPRAFGHVGFTNVVGWADPERGTAVGLMTSGKPLLYPGLVHLLDIGRRISEACPKR